MNNKLNKTYKIIGEKSKIGKLIKENIDSDFRYSDTLDNGNIIFLCERSNESEIFIKEHEDKDIHIIDLSGVRKLNSYLGIYDEDNLFYDKSLYKNMNFSYGYDIIVGDSPVKKHISNTGCSSRGILSVVFPIREFLNENINVHTLFPQSALSYKSKNHFNEDEVSPVDSFTHYHQREVEYVLKEKFSINMASDITSMKNGLHITIFCKLLDEDINIYNYLKNFYKDNKEVKIFNKLPNTSTLIDNNCINISVEQNYDDIVFKVSMDNLMIGGALSAINNAKRFFI